MRESIRAYTQERDELRADFKRAAALLAKLLDPEHCLTFETRDEGHAFFKMDDIEQGRTFLDEALRRWVGGTN